VGIDDRAAGHAICQLATDGLDLGKLGHAIKRTHPRLDYGTNSPCVANSVSPDGVFASPSGPPS
jgi:hypothetical protein